MLFIFLKKKLNNNPKNILYILYMNWKYLLNTLIILLIIIVFLDKIYRKAPQSQSQSQVNTSQENIVQENFENKPKPTLGKEYVSNTSLEKNFIIRPGNFYSSNENIVNFPSNVLDVSQYYVRNFPDSNQNLSENSENVPINPPVERSKVGQPNFSDYNYENKIQNEPHMWNYQNDLVMNGGKIGDFIGNGYYDLNYAFAENKYTNKQIRDEVLNDYKNDDLRMGLGVPAKMEMVFDD
jgi:hypothetical protein